MQVELERALSSWRRYADAEPWRSIDSDALFRLDDSRSGESFYALIMGRLGTLYGLSLSRGEEGLRTVGALIKGAVDFDQAATSTRSICITKDDDPIPKWYRNFLRESLGRTKGFKGLPLIYAYEGARKPRLPEGDELRLLADAMDAIAALVEGGAWKPPIFEPGRPMPCIRLRADGGFDLGEVTPEYRPPPVERYRIPPARLDDLRKLPRLDGTDLASCGTAPATVQGRQVRLLAVSEAESDLVLAAHCAELGDHQGLGRSLLSAYEGRNMIGRRGLPREIQTDSRYFYETFKDALTDLGIRVTCFERIPALERLRRSFADYLEEPS